MTFLTGDNGVLAAIVLFLFIKCGGLYINRKYYWKKCICFISDIICEIRVLRSFPAYRRECRKYILETMEFGKKYRRFSKKYSESKEDKE